jgi:segregation and condensation protein A
MTQIEQDILREEREAAIVQADEQQDRYVVHLPTFEGPLDLLLHLIEKRQMEITTISLVAVTDQYLDYLHQWQTSSATGESEASEGVLPLANMAAFVAVAARLLYIKSQSLLPQVQRDEVASEVESAITMAEELQRHLLEYKLAKEVANHLRQREETGLQTHARSNLLAGIEAQLSWTPPKLVGLEVQSLAHALQRLLVAQAREEGDASLLPTARVRVSERIAEIVSRLQEHESILFTEVIEQEHSAFVIVVTFLAVLELWKWERIEVAQESLLGPIRLQRGERWGEATIETSAVDNEMEM